MPARRSTVEKLDSARLSVRYVRMTYLGHSNISVRYVRMTYLGHLCW